MVQENIHLLLKFVNQLYMLGLQVIMVRERCIRLSIWSTHWFTFLCEGHSMRAPRYSACFTSCSAAWLLSTSFVILTYVPCIYRGVCAFFVTSMQKPRISDFLFISLYNSMQAGFGMLETGLVSSRNAGNILMKNLLDMATGSLGWFIVGWGL